MNGYLSRTVIFEILVKSRLFKPSKKMHFENLKTSHKVAFKIAKAGKDQCT